MGSFWAWKNTCSLVTCWLILSLISSEKVGHVAGLCLMFRFLVWILTAWPGNFRQWCWIWNFLGPTKVAILIRFGRTRRNASKAHHLWTKWLTPTINGENVRLCRNWFLVYYKFPNPFFSICLLDMELFLYLNPFILVDVPCNFYNHLHRLFKLKWIDISGNLGARPEYFIRKFHRCFTWTQCSLSCLRNLSPK